MKTLKEIRTEKGIRQNFVAEKLGISKSALCRKEKSGRKFTAVEVQKLCELYQVNIAEIKF